MIPASLKQKIDAFGIHPRDFANLKSVGKSVDDMSKAQKLISQAKNYGRHVVRDARGMRRTARLSKHQDRLFNPATFVRRGKKIGANAFRGWREREAEKIDLKAVAGLSANQAQVAKARKFLGTLATRQKAWQGRHGQARKATAMRVGAAALGTAGAIYGVKAFKRYRKKAKEKTRYRDYDVVKTPHGHQAIGRQAYNQPYYNEVEPPAVFGPRR
jgi:hypothetical protein